jgi:putative phosphoesterase
MRIALISDIHGNLVSLEAVLADIHREQVDQVICLGDLATLGPQPREVLARLKALECPCVMGNHDSFLLDPGSLHEYTDSSQMVELVDWCASQLSEADLDYLGSLRPLIEIPLDTQATLLCFHGSPQSNVDRILATTPTAELDRMLAGHTATVMACGHMHVQMLRQHKGTLIVNVGSVGQPFEQRPFEDEPRLLPCAQYATVNWVNGALGIDLRWVPIDLDAVKQAVLTSAMPGAASWAECWP